MHPSEKTKNDQVSIPSHSHLPHSDTTKVPGMKWLSTDERFYLRVMVFFLSSQINKAVRATNSAQ